MSLKKRFCKMYNYPRRKYHARLVIGEKYAKDLERDYDYLKSKHCLTMGECRGHKAWCIGAENE